MQNTEVLYEMPDVTCKIYPRKRGVYGIMRLGHVHIMIHMDIYRYHDSYGQFI